MKTPGSGRKAGTPNKSAVDLQEIADRIGVNIFEVLCLIAKGDMAALGEEKKIDINARLGAAKEAAKYLYSQRKAVELSGSETDPFVISIHDYTKDS